MWEKGVDGSYNIDTHDVHTVKEWIEINKDTISEDIVPNEPKMTSNYERVIDKFRKDIPEDKMKEYDLISNKIKDFVQDRGYIVKIINIFKQLCIINNLLLYFINFYYYLLL